MEPVDKTEKTGLNTREFKGDIRLKLLPAATAFRVSRDTIRRGLAELKIEADRHGDYSLYDIHRAIVGDQKAERIRGLRLDNSLKEAELAQELGRLMDTDSAMATFNAMMLPIRQKLLALEAEMKHRCNPTDPELAGVALGEWTQNTMRLLKADLKAVVETVNNPEKE